ncbi:MAG TPA: hypothetical protein VFB72_19655 [Verrucomicrobiae bacterium]|nr:hypothetical protein [Verrucomicrobiae bacterium]
MGDFISRQAGGFKKIGPLAFLAAIIKIVLMTKSEFAKLAPSHRVNWLDDVSPTQSWKLGDDVFCLHCDAIFKAEDVACDTDGDPTCPACQSSTPLDFHHMPWWREDLCQEVDSDEQYAWKGKPLHATPGKPDRLPKSEKN